MGRLANMVKGSVGNGGGPGTGSCAIVVVAMLWWSFVTKELLCASCEMGLAAPPPLFLRPVLMGSDGGCPLPESPDRGPRFCRLCQTLRIVAIIFIE
jgi:hypothetical protein